jgi:imidazolonepropionase
MTHTDVYVHASELLTGAGIAEKDGRHPTEKDLGQIEDAALVLDHSKVKWFGKTKDLPKKYLKAKNKNLKLKQAIVPGFVDCHNHLIFAGNRADEFAKRCAGATYEEIASQGGGILKTVRATRQASEAELLALGIERVKEAYRHGVRALEIKSGYGLSLEAEIKCLRVAGLLKKKFPEINFTTTFLGAHAFPPVEECSRADYIDQILREMLPLIAKKKLADACDIFIDRGYFSLKEGMEILGKARSLGLKIKIHGDELVNTESAEFAVRLKAQSVDHLLQVSEKGITALGSSRETVAVLLPGTAFYLKAAYAPARALIDAGACVAIATDFNPGSCMSNNLSVMMTLAALYMKMSRAEIFAAVTYNAAKALGIENRYGSIAVGKACSPLVLPYERFEELYYRFG